MNFEFGRNGSYDNFLTPIELKMLHYGFKNFDIVLQKSTCPSWNFSYKTE